MAEPVLERELVSRGGARFFEHEGRVLFELRPDTFTVIGPMRATDELKMEYAGEWKQFQFGRLPQLDHDKDGYPGGSATAGDRLNALLEEEPAPAPKRRGRPPKTKE